MTKTPGGQSGQDGPRAPWRKTQEATGVTTGHCPVRARGGGGTCTEAQYERMTQQCSRVDREFRDWIDSLLYSDSLSCRTMERGLQEHINAYESCYRRVEARDPSFRDCNWASDLESWRQITAGTFGSSCED